jgi:uncharacterized protein DUF4440
MLASQRAIAADDRTDATRADQALMAALAKGDKQAAGTMFDAAFTWTVADGATHNKAETLDHLADIAASTKDESDVATHFYGRVLTVRVWVPRDGRWQLAISQQATIQSAAAVAAVTSKK